MINPGQPDDPARLLRDFFRPRGVDLDAQATVIDLFRTQADVFSMMELLALRPLGLTHAGFVLLMSLWTMGPLETRVLARLQGVSRPAVVSAVDTLERQGLVQRVRSKVDRRLVTVKITRSGVGRVEMAQRETHKLERALTRAMTKADQRRLSRLLHALGSAARDIAKASTDDRGRKAG
jgi:DNA-binding MarR family transcriptional regulator